VTEEQARRVLGLVGLGLRARTAVVGTAQVRAAVRQGQVKIALVAGDAAANSRDKLLPLLRARRVRVVEDFSASQLGAVAGRGQTAAIGVVDPSLAKGILGVVDAGLTRPA
jgi:ribosomal protein L7Ae-like RNA K-turn-binding protein